MQFTHQRAEIGLALDRPIGRQDHAPRAVELVQQKLPEMPCQRLPGCLAVGDRQFHTFGTQARPLRLAPARDITRLFGIDRERIEVIRRDLSGIAGRRGESAMATGVVRIITHETVSQFDR